MKKLCLLLSLLILLLATTSCGQDPIIENTPPDNFSLIGVSTPATTPAEPTPDPTPESIHAPFERADELNSRGIYVLDVLTGEGVFALNENEPLKPASTTKIMTLVTALSMLAEEEIDEAGIISVPWLIWERFETDDPNTVGGSMSAIVGAQTTLTYRDLFFALMLSSGNEAANIIAYNLGKKLNADAGLQNSTGFENIDAFTGAMNAKARQLELRNTQFANAHGLNEPGGYASAKDMALITRYGVLNYPEFVNIVSTLEHQMPVNRNRPNGYRIRNTNMLINDPELTETANAYFRDYVRGVKTGGLNKVYDFDSATNAWVESAGIANLVSMGEFAQSRYIIATLEAPWNAATSVGVRLHFAYNDHHDLYDWLQVAYS